MKTLMVCSLAKNTGAYVRGKYLAKWLNKEKLNVNFMSTFKRMPYDLYYLFSFPHNLFRSFFNRCDVAISLKAFPNATFPVLLKKLFGAKAVLDIDDLDYGLRPGLSNIIKILQEPFVRYFDLVMVHNPKLYKYVNKKLKVPKKKILQIEQAVDIELFKKLDKVKTRKELGYSKDEKLIVYTAHISPAAFLEEIFMMFKEVSKDVNAKLVVVGSGPKLKEYKELAMNMNIKVDFTGYVEDINNVVKYLNIADACVVYYPETEANEYRCSMKLREYLAVGVPTVCNSFADLARFDDYTYNFETDNLKSFKRAMIEALAKPDGRELKGMKFIKNNMSWETVAKKIAERIKQC